MSPLFLKYLRGLCTDDEVMHSYNCFFPEPSANTQLEKLVPWLVRSCKQIISEHLWPAIPVTESSSAVISVEEVVGRAIWIAGYTDLPSDDVFDHYEFLEVFLSLTCEQIIAGIGSDYEPLDPTLKLRRAN